MEMVMMMLQWRLKVHRRDCRVSFRDDIMCFIVQTPVSPQVNVTHEVQFNSNSPYVQRLPDVQGMIYLNRQNSDRDYPVLHLTFD